MEPDRFILGHDERQIIVVMDGWKQFARIQRHLRGQWAAVSGCLTEEFFTKNEIKPTSVLAGGRIFHNEGRVGVAGHRVFPMESAAQHDIWLTLHGVVTEVSEQGFRLDTGIRVIEVSVGRIDDNPLDGRGYPQIRVGDEASVYGLIDDATLFDEQRLNAFSVVVAAPSGRIL